MIVASRAQARAEWYSETGDSSPDRARGASASATTTLARREILTTKVPLAVQSRSECGTLYLIKPLFSLSERVKLIETQYGIAQSNTFSERL